MELLDTLRQRCQRRTATVTCGGLGEVIVQALSPKDCSTLSAGADGNRAVVYAACRALQAAGETLRAEGTLFTPEEIMQYISNEEADQGARAVRRISGLEEAGHCEDAEKVEQAFEQSGTTDGAETDTAPNDSPKRHTAAATSDGQVGQPMVARKNADSKTPSACTGGEMPMVDGTTNEKNPPRMTPTTRMKKQEGQEQANPIAEASFLGRDAAPQADLNNKPMEEKPALSTFSLRKDEFLPEGEASQGLCGQAEKREEQAQENAEAVKKTRERGENLPGDGIHSLPETALELPQKSGSEPWKTLSTGDAISPKLEAERSSATFDEEIARPLLEGLLRAAGAR